MYDNMSHVFSMQNQTGSKKKLSLSNVINGWFHGNGRTFRDSFSTFKHTYHKDLVCENKSNVIIVWLYTIPFIFKQNLLTYLFCLQNMHINEAGNGRTVKWTWAFHPVHILCKVCEFCELILF